MNEILEKIGAVAVKTIAPLGTKCGCWTEGQAEWFKEGNALPGPKDPKTGQYASADGELLDGYIFRNTGLVLVVGMLVAGFTTALVLRGMPKSGRRRAVYRRRTTSTTRRRRVTRRAPMRRATSRPRYARAKYTRK